MKTPYCNRFMPFIGIFLALFTWLANTVNSPDGKTAAPFDGSCNECHSSGNFNGTVTVDGLPDPVDPNTTYPLTITLTPMAGSPTNGGFQLVVVDGDGNNAGDLYSANAQSGTDIWNGREYLESRIAKNFTGGGPIVWTFNWKSPTIASGNAIKFYFMGCFANGDQNEAGDIGLGYNTEVTFNGIPVDVDNVVSEVGMLDVWPNPAANDLTVSWKHTATIKEGIIYNHSGHRMMVFSEKTTPTTVSVSHLPAGTYFLYVEFDDGQITSIPWVKAD